MLIVVCTGFAFGDLKSVLPLKGSSRKEESFMSGLSMACIDITALLHESFPRRKMHYIHVIDVSFKLHFLHKNIRFFLRRLRDYEEFIPTR